MKSINSEIYNEKCEQFYVAHRENQEVKRGDLVSETTSEFTWNGVDGCFDNEATEYTEVIAREFWFDESEFIAEKSTNGGAYGYYHYVVVEVLE